MSRRPRGDEGAYAILYGLLIFVVLGVSAVVVDLATMRQDRRQSRLAADAAVVAAARNLDPLGGNPFQACLDAWSYIHTNLGVPIPASTGCNNFPTSITNATCPAPPGPGAAVASSGNVTVTITWPVYQDSPLLTNPDAAPAGSGVTARGVDPKTDGSAADACSRIAVSIAQTESPSFSALFGVGDTTTQVTSVARATNKPGKGTDIAALNVLNPHVCDAVSTDGKGIIQVSSIGGRAGIIAIESDGHDSANSCPPKRPFVLDPGKTSSGGYIRADGPSGPGTGTILMYAMNGAPTGNPTQAYDPSLSSALLAPTPTVLAKPSGTAPVTDFVSCNGSCTTVSQDYIALLRSKLGTANPPAPYPNADAPYGIDPFQTLPGITVPTPVPPVGFGCSIGTGQKFYLPPGNWFIDCPTLTIQGTLVVGGGTLVTAGGIDVKGGCFAVNVPVATVPLTSCPTDTVVTENPPTYSIVYMRAGSLTTSGSYSILLPRTFVYMASGNFDIAANATAVVWTNPRTSDPACVDDECLAAHFAKIALWTLSTTGGSMGGQGGLVLRGVMFMPNANFTYTGQGFLQQTNAQFWADTITVKSQGGLLMAPDPTDSFPTPLLSVVLIR